VERLFADEASTLAKAITATGYVGYPVPQRDRGALILRYRNLHSATTADRSTACPAAEVLAKDRWPPQRTGEEAKQVSWR
jgi:hypothetical protein